MGRVEEGTPYVMEAQSPREPNRFKHIPTGNDLLVFCRMAGGTAQIWR